MSDFFHCFNYFLAPKNDQKSSHMSVVPFFSFFFFFLKPSVSSRMKELKGKLGILNLT